MSFGPEPAPFGCKCPQPRNALTTDDICLGLSDRYGDQDSLFVEEHEPLYSERWHELYQEHLTWTSIKSCYIRCECPHRIAHVDRLNYCVCGSCGLYTHLHCIKAGVSNKLGLGLHYICNQCRTAVLKGLIEILKDAVIDEDDKQEDEPPPDLFSYVVHTLWPIYCLLPNEKTSEAVVRATRLVYAGDKFLPVHEPSLQWAERVHQEIMAILDHLPMVKRGEIFDGPTLVFDDGFFARLRTAVLWSINYGYFIKEEEEIGLLVEIVGLKSKGFFWKGWWPTIDPQLRALLDRQADQK